MTNKVNYILLLLLFVCFACNENKSKNTTQVAQSAQTKQTNQSEQTEELEIEPIEESSGILKNTKYVKDFGEISLGKRLVCEFTLQNIGNEDLKILEHTASCNCSEVKYNEYIPANDSIKIFMLVDTKGKKLGKHEVSALLKTNGSQRRFYEFRAKFSVID